MALQCQLNLDKVACTAGATPPIKAWLTVYNPGAVSVVVTGVRVYPKDISGRASRVAMSEVSFPSGPGMSTVVPALSSVVLGPVAIAVASGGNVSPGQQVEQVTGEAAVNDQPTQRPQEIVVVSATVSASDGSTSEAGGAGLLVSYEQAPPAGSSGGSFTFFAGSGSNFLTGLQFGVI